MDTQIPNYPNYTINEESVVKSKPRPGSKGGTITQILNSKTGYYTVVLYNNEGPRRIAIHTLLAIVFKGHVPNGHTTVIDHINNIRTDNRLSNLQITTNRVNCTKDQQGFTSEYTGVTWHKKARKWVANIKIEGKLAYLGLFTEEIDAANAYQNKLREV